MPGPIFTCKNCPDRKPGCHGKCERYKQCKAVYEERKKQERIRTGLNAAESKRLYRVNQCRTNKKYYINKGGAHE